LFYPCPENAGAGQKIFFPHAKKSLVVIVFNIFQFSYFQALQTVVFED